MLAKLFRRLSRSADIDRSTKASRALLNQPEIVYAGFWRRVAATLIDSLMFMVIIVLVAGPTLMNAPIWSLEGMLRTIATMAVTLWLWKKFMGTPGKLLLGCQVVDADTFKALSTKQGLIRYFAYLASMLPLMLGFLWIAFDARKQSFHDKIANSVVVFNADFETDDESTKTLQQLMAEVR